MGDSLPAGAPLRKSAYSQRPTPTPTFLVVLVTAGLGIAFLAGAVTSFTAPSQPTNFHSAQEPTLSSDGGLRGAGDTVPAASGVGSVIDTLDLASNRLLPGNQQPAVQASPQMVLFAPSTGDFYVRGDDGSTISVIDPSSNTVVTSITVGIGGSAYVPNVATMADDPATGYLYEVNPQLLTVGVIQESTNLLTDTIHLGASPGGIIFDPDSGNFYTSNWESDNVSVISAATNLVVKSIPVGGEPGALLYDPNDGEVYVSNFNTGNVSIIDTATEAVVANPATGTVGAEPQALALDTKDDLVSVVNALTSNLTVINGTTNAVTASVGLGLTTIPMSATYVASTDTLLVANGASDNVTVIQEPANTLIASIPIGHGAEGAAFDSVNGYVYTANYGSNNISVLDPANNSLVRGITTGNFPEDLGVDTVNGDVYVANLGTYDTDANLTVISGSTSVPVASILLQALPTSLTAAPNGDLYAIDYGGAQADIISLSTNLVAGTASADAIHPTDSAYDTATGDLFIVSEPTGTVNMVTAAGSEVKVLGLGFGADGAAFDPTNGFVYISNYYSGNITVLYGTNGTVDKIIEIQDYDSLGAEIYDPADQSVYVADYSNHNVTVVKGTVTTASIQVGSYPSSFAYDPANDTIFVANYGSGNVSVINASTNQLVGSFESYFPDYLAYDSASNALYMASEENGELDAYNATTYTSVGPPLDIASSVEAGGVAYSPISGDVYVANEYEGSISIISTSNVTNYSVSFIENGLVAGTTWSVTLGGVANQSATPDVDFVELNGTYAFSVGTVAGYSVNVSSGHVTVNGSSVAVDLGFTAISTSDDFPVTFNETGLPSGTQWGVSLTPTVPGGTSSGAAPTPNVMQVPNGTYTFSITPVSGYSAAPSTGSLTVAGLPVYQTVVFTAGSTSLSAALAISPATITVGDETNFTTTAAGGTSPYSYVYSGLPKGCATADLAVLACSPTVTGTFVVTVNVTDHVGATVSAHATLVVNAAPNGPSTSTTGPSTLEWGLLVAIILIALLLALFFFLARRRKKQEPAPVPSSSGPGAPPPPAPPAGAS
jgi:YVTN family beta-propeller protein